MCVSSALNKNIKASRVGHKPTGGTCLEVTGWCDGINGTGEGVYMFGRKMCMLQCAWW